MRKLWKVFIGLLIAGVGVIAALNALGIADINLFFKGWWTLFIIIPCTVNLFTDSDKTASLIGIAFGVALLLAVREIIEFRMLFKLAIPALIIIIGLRIAFDDVLTKNSREVSAKIKENEINLRKYSAIFNSSSINLAGQAFNGALLTAAFGSLDLDLSNSVITSDCAVRVTSVFGSVKIRVPNGVNVKMSSNTVFGDTKNSKNGVFQGAPTVYVKCVCVFGGIDLK